MYFCFQILDGHLVNLWWRLGWLWSLPGLNPKSTSGSCAPPSTFCWAVIQPWWTKLPWLYRSWRWSLWEVWQTSLPTKSKMWEILLILHTSSKSHGSWNCWCLLGWLCPSHFIGLFRVSQSLRWQMAHRASPCYQKRRDWRDSSHARSFTTLSVVKTQNVFILHL